MNKKFIFALLFGILLIGAVSAGITGYLVRGGALADNGYKATLQGVDRSGVATVSVQTPSGTTEVVRVAEGKTATVDGAKISASGLTRGTLFKRAGGSIELKTADESNAVAKIATAGAGGSVSQSLHTHLSDYDISGENSATFIRNPNNTNNVYVELPCYSGTFPVDAGFNLDFNTPQSADILPVIQWKYHNYDTYYIGFWDPSEIIKTGPYSSSCGYVSCAKVEPTLHQFGQDY